MIGSPTARMQRRYINTKAPPPSVPALYGKPQIFPKPTAEPAAASTNVDFPPQQTVSFIFEEVFPTNVEGYSLTYNDEEFKGVSVFDEKDKSYATSHKRWLYSIERLEKIVNECNGTILECEEGYFSPNKNTETNNPLLIRMIIKKD